MIGNASKAGLCSAALVVLCACARDSEETIEARLAGWFHLGDRFAFQSRMRCTAAAFEVVEDRPKSTLAVQMDLVNAKRQFRQGRVGAIRMGSFSPNDMADALLLSGDGAFGKQALAAVAQAVPCVVGTGVEGLFRNALTRPGGTLVYDHLTEGVIVLDPIAMVVVYLAGDVW